MFETISVLYNSFNLSEHLINILLLSLIVGVLVCCPVVIPGYYLEQVRKRKAREELEKKVVASELDKALREFESIEVQSIRINRKLEKLRKEGGLTITKSFLTKKGTSVWKEC